MKNHISINILTVVLFSSYASAGTWATLDVPTDWGTLTQITGISGSRVVGTYLNSYNTHSFVYDGETWTKLDKPGAQSTLIQDNYGNSAVGYYFTPGPTNSFLYDGASWTTLSKSGAATIYARGIYGSNIVGGYSDSSGTLHGFIHDGVNWTTVDKEGAAGGTTLMGISGNDIVGEYYDAAGMAHPFLYNQGSWTDLPSNPWSPASPGMEIVVDISGNYIIGNGGSFGMLYDGTSWTKLEMPGAITTGVSGIDGNKIVGSYTLPDNPMEVHGFVYTIPEPCTLILMGLGAAILRPARVLLRKKV